jgi:hypothetical protein
MQPVVVETKDNDLSNHFTWEELKNSQHYFTYNVKQYPFHFALRNLWNFMDLENNLSDVHEHQEHFHSYLDREGIEYNKDLHGTKLTTDQESCFHAMFYRKNASRASGYFQQIYLKFVHEVVLPLFAKSEGNRFVVQAFPTFRTQIPNTTALGENRHFIKEQPSSLPSDATGYHCDAQYLHPAGEINFILALTDMFDTNTIMVETQPDSEKFLPVTQSLGSFFQFYGNKCHHFNFPNKTGKTRISIDFRIIPMSRFNCRDENRSLTQGKQFKLGGYYIEMDRDDFLVARPQPIEEEEQEASKVENM